MFEKRASQTRRQSKEAMLNGIDIHETYLAMQLLPLLSTKNKDALQCSDSNKTKQQKFIPCSYFASSSPSSMLLFR